jgi:hypothetical protein
MSKDAFHSLCVTVLEEVRVNLPTGLAGSLVTALAFHLLEDPTITNALYDVLVARGWLAVRQPVQKP